MITYIADKPSVSSSVERKLITIEFAPTIQTEESEYSFEHPQFVFGDVVNLSNPGLNYPAIQYTICALELVESKTEKGQLLNQPYWKYKISDGEKTLWKEESALIRYQDQPSTCKDCQHFNNYQDSEGKGWCNQFELPARTDHFQTNDCILNHSSEFAFPTKELIDEADLPHSEYQRGDTVKVIDSQEHHSEWAIFKITECHHNPKRYRNTKSYLSEPDWFYSLSNIDGNIPFLVSEIEICDADMSWNINTSNEPF